MEEEYRIAENEKNERELKRAKSAPKTVVNGEQDYRGYGFKRKGDVFVLTKQPSDDKGNPVKGIWHPDLASLKDYVDRRIKRSKTS